MRKIFEKIWELALPYQDLRDDSGHAKIVSKYAAIINKNEKGEIEVVMPAAILHDIGWSQLTREERLGINRNTFEIRKKHENEGVRLAKGILKEVDYNNSLVPEILEIISGHDTRIGFFSKNDGIVRDADKLWRYTRRGMEVGVKAYKIPIKDQIESWGNWLDKPGFFYSESAREIARIELEKRIKDNQN
ncbi:MAG: HD domain-containing protein [Candidatus Pacearchaeota archaeon]